MTGRTIAHYEILDKLGEGGMGVVYKARDTRLDRFVAVKVLPPEKVANPVRKQRFIQEAKAASALNHPNIITIHDISTEDGLDFMVMEYVDGKTLDHLIPREGMRPGELLKNAVQIADALAAAHEAGIVHRDLKPGNVMVSNKGLVKVLDFGLAKLLEPGETGETDATLTAVQEPAPKTVEGTILGTISYMSPEQAEGKRIDARSDIFSFGSLLYEMATGRRAFTGDTQLSTLSAVLKDEPKPAGQIAEGLPGELERIINRCLRKDPNRRFQGMADLKVALEESRGEPPAPPRRKLLPLLAAALALLVVALAAGWWWRDSSNNSLEPSIAVMPFLNQSPEPDTEYFSDGMTDELISALTRIKGLKVVSRSSVFRFKGTEYDIRDVGERLGVATVLEGTVRKAGERLRISVQLTNVADGFNLWSQTFDREVRDVFDVQEEICRAMVGALEAELIDDPSRRIVRRSTENPRAYELFLRGQHYLLQFTPAGIEKSQSYFEEALRIDPDYPMAHLGLALSDETAVSWGLASPSVLGRAEARAQRALTIDDALPEAHNVLGHVMMRQWEWAAAERSLERAIELNPSLALAHHSYAVLQDRVGPVAQALEASRRAVGLDPLNSLYRWRLSVGLIHAGQYDEAIQQAEAILEVDERFSLAYGTLGEAYSAMGRSEEAVQAFKRASELTSGVIAERFLAAQYVAAGRPADVQVVLSSLLERRKTSYVSAYAIGSTYLDTGEDDRAFEWFETAFQERDPYLPDLRWTERLRNDPRYHDLMRRMNVSEPR